MSTLMDSDNVVLPFGKQLAANEKKTRDKAVRSLQQFLSSKSELSESDLLKLWKGLFYCFWMSDKPLIQQALSETLGSLVMSLQQQNAIAFLGAFWQIHCDEWHGIDRIRLDKYYMLLRRVVHYTFKYIGEHDWDLGIIDDYSELLKNGPLKYVSIIGPTNNKIPNSIRYHLADIYLDELEKVVNAQLEKLDEEEDIEIPTTELLDPFINLLAKTPNKITANKVVDNVFSSILEKFATGMKAMLEIDDEDNEEDRPPFIYDVETLHPALAKAAQDPDTHSPNRKKLAALEKRFKDLIPGEEGENDEEEDDDEAPTLVATLDEEDEEDLEEDDDSARKTGWMNEFTAGDLIADELKEEPKPKERRRPDNGLLGGKMVSIDASTLDISGLETKVAPSEQPKPKKAKKSKKQAEEPVELVEAVEDMEDMEDVEDMEDMEPEEIEETEEIVTGVSDDGQSTTTKVTKKKKVQWVLDQNTIRRFQKARPIAAVATSVEPRVVRPMKSAIKITPASSEDGSEQEDVVVPNGHTGKKRKAAAAPSKKNGATKRKKAKDFF
ncbi:hypothetical protein INT43_000273 [Umbelopsis isabellina]|uniref:Uncharacterized protein n=1 Tax=Mortierella isabellina TaxID=91625 RepID=A0A8H7Q0X2_MORIS|nr:hypothetical protein INT43_000273 [Umbelopsis isabellina]